jgi:hypothetical protein
VRPRALPASAFTCHAGAGGPAITVRPSTDVLAGDFVLDCTNAQGFQLGQQVSLYDGNGNLLLGGLPVVGLAQVNGGAPGPGSVTVPAQAFAAAGYTDSSQVPTPFYIVADSILFRFSRSTVIGSSDERIVIPGAHSLVALDRPTSYDLWVRDLPLPPDQVPWQVASNLYLSPGMGISILYFPGVSRLIYDGPFLDGPLPALDPRASQVCLYRQGLKVFHAETLQHQQMSVRAVSGPRAQQLASCLTLPTTFASSEAIEAILTARASYFGDITLAEEGDSGNLIAVDRVATQSGTIPPVTFYAGTDYTAGYAQTSSGGTTSELDKITITNPFFGGVFGALSCPGAASLISLSGDPPGTTFTSTSSSWQVTFTPPLAANTNAVTGLKNVTPSTAEKSCTLFLDASFTGGSPLGLPVDFPYVTMPEALRLPLSSSSSSFLGATIR